MSNSILIPSSEAREVSKDVKAGLPPSVAKQLQRLENAGGECRRLSWESFLELRMDPANDLRYVSFMTYNIYGDEIAHFVVEHGDEVVDYTLPKRLELMGPGGPTVRHPKAEYYEKSRAHNIIKVDRAQFQVFLDVLYTYVELEGRDFAQHSEVRQLMAEIVKKWKSKHSGDKNAKREFRFRFGRRTTFARH